MHWCYPRLYEQVLMGYTNVNLTINDIMIAFIKNGDINCMFRNYKINTWQEFIYNMSRFINNLCTPSIWRERNKISCSDKLVMSFFHHLKQRALKSPVINEQYRKLIIYISKKNIKIYAETFKLIKILVWWTINTA